MSTGSHKRNKGKVGELEVVHLLRDYGWKDARRTSDGRGQQTRGDVTNGPEGVHIEVKRQERVNIPAALRQAMDDCAGLDIPVVVHRPSRHGWMATIPLVDLLELLAFKERA